MKLKNRYFISRHSESLKNVKGFQSSWPEKIRVPLTERGKKQAMEVARKIRAKKADLIFCSDLLRTKQTAEIVGREIGLKPVPDKRLREVGLGIFNGKPSSQFVSFWNQGKRTSPLEHYGRRFKLPLPGGETYKEVELRLTSFMKEMEKKYRGKNILVVSHKRSLTLLEKVVKSYSLKKFVKIILGKKEIKIDELRKL